MWAKFFNWLRAPFGSNWPVNLQNIMVSIAIIASGWWALYSYDAFKQRDLAVQNLEKVKSDLAIASAELKEIQARIDGNYSSTIELLTDVVPLPNGNNGLIISIEAKNVGTRDVTLDLQNAPVKVYSLKHKRELLKAEKIYTPRYYQTISDHPDKESELFKTQYLSIGAVKRLEFFTEVEKKGLYYITFQGGVSAKHAESLDLNESESPVWFASKFVVID